MEEQPIEKKESLISRLMPRGIRHPDSLVKNRDLFIGGGPSKISPVPGARPQFNKSLLTGLPSPTSGKTRLGVQRISLFPTGGRTSSRVGSTRVRTARRKTSGRRTRR